VTQRSVGGNFAWTLSAGLVYALAQWGVLVLYARLGTMELVGEFALGLAITAPVMLLARMQIRTLQATDAQGAYRFEHYLGLMVLTVLGGVLLCCAITWVAGYSARASLVIALLALAKGFEALSEVFYGALQRAERMSLIARSIIAKSVLSVVLVALALWTTGSSAVAVAALGLSWALVLILFDAQAYRSEFKGERPWRWLWQTPWREQGVRLKSLLGLAYALGITALLSSLRPNVPRYILEAHFGQTELGMFAALAYFTVLGGRVVQSLGQAVTPRLGRYHAEGDQRRFGRMLAGFTAGAALVGVCAIAGSVLLGRWALTLFYGAAYAQNLKLFVWLMVAAALEYLCVSLQMGLTAARELKAQVLMLVGSTVVVALGSAWWVPSVGPVGAAWALTLGWLVELVCSAGLTVRAWRRLGTQEREHMHRQAGAGLFLKQCIDRLAAAVGLLCLSPVMGATALIIWATMGRPALFRQVRPGRGGRLFQLVKFRTMLEAKGADGHPLPDAQRLTRTGQLLRAASLDELPQLWNVLRGDMSLVGPRPLLVEYLPRYSSDQARRHEVLPGITGWAQVNGRNTLDWDERFRLDVWYVDHWSLALDAKILALTLLRVVQRQGISYAGDATMFKFLGSATQAPPRPVPIGAAARPAPPPPPARGHRG
jgi:lipopolysaccharide/colanic/teichoic acid biosynthesis glycosyltransferase/O-antigen/teichoic acid export membrane protein